MPSRDGDYLQRPSAAAVAIRVGGRALIVLAWLTVLTVLMTLVLVACSSGIASNVVNSL